jgi:Carboxypeptidase regulatory-like domain/TonB dependent receptor-like, beta-barrel
LDPECDFGRSAPDSTLKRFLQFFAVGLFLAMALNSPVWAQSSAANGALTGTVIDPQGKSVPGASINVRNIDLAFVRTIQSGADGTFSLALLPPGTYMVEAKAQGLVLARPLRVNVNVGSSVRLTLRLSLAGTSQQVTVRGRATSVEGNTVAPAVNKQEAETGNFIAGLTDTYLPNRDRDFSQFEQLAAGAAPNANGTQLSIAGQRAVDTKMAVDGADFDDPLEGRQRGASDGALFFPQTVVREFNIVHAGVGADVGGTNAGFVNVVTKEGSDKLHGEAMYTGRPPWLTSNDAFGRSLANEQNVFGGSLGGPIQRGKAFFYVGAEQDFLDVPYWTEFQAQAPGVVVPPSLANEQRQIVEANHPTALFGRFDVLLSPRNTLNAELDFNRIRATEINEIASTRTDATQSDGVSLSGQSVWIRGGLTTLIGARTVNQFMAQWASDRRDFSPNSVAPEIVINGFGTLGGSSLGFHRYTSDTRELNDDLAISRNTNSFRVGADFAYDPGTEEHEASLNGRFDFSSLADYLADNPRRYQQTFATGDTIYSGTVRQLGLYAMDKVPLSKKLTLTAGLRWDGQWNPQPSHPDPAIAQTAQIPNDLAQWQPRLGLAWNPAANTVVRFSSGLYDSPTPATMFQRVFTDNGLNTVVADSYFDPQILPLVAAPNLVFHPLVATPSGLSTPAALVVGIAPGFRNPRSFQFAGSVEQQVNRKVNITAGYLRDSTWDLPVLLNLNLEAPTIDSEGMPIFPATRPNPAVGQLFINESAAHSSYDGMLLTANFQLSRRTQVVANYTLSHTRDDGSNDAPFGISSALDPFDLAAEASDSSLDVRHEFNVSALFWLPLGFKIDPIFVAHSGLPYTPVIGLDTQDDANDLNDRAIINGMVAARNSFRQPAFYNLDIRIVKDITLPGEGHHLDLFMDIFNVTAADNFNFGPNGISMYGTLASPIFTAGQALFAPDTAHFGGAREVQFTARLVAF